MRWVSRFMGVVVAMTAFLVLTTGAASAASARGPASAIGADVITEVQPLGWRVVAVAVEYDRVIDIGEADIPESAFTVNATVGGTTGPRTVVDVYTSEEAELDRRGPRGRPGRYLIIELDPADPNAMGLIYDVVTGINNPVPLAGAYAVTQTAPVVDEEGNVQLRPTPFAIHNRGAINLIVDEFASMSYTDSAGTRLNFRLFQPERRERRSERDEGHPLVVFLHGGGERGANNISQITANQGAVAFARPGLPASAPSYVLAAQVPVGSRWTTPEIQAALLGLIDRIVVTHAVDRDRLDLTGLSMGGMGGFDILPKRPEMFAGALLIAGRGDPAVMPLMVDVPLWATHSVDDPTVDYETGTLALINALEAAGARVTRGEWPGNLPDRAAEAEALQLWAEAEANDSHTLLTTYPEGTTPVSAHWSWVPTYLNDVMIDWLLSQDRQDPPAGPQAQRRGAAR